ncbi:MAG: hypothetical protein ACTSQH_00080 [Candidatus Hodarchaeales archaeon]
MLIKELHTNEENAFVVDNYPYGFKKTLKKFWIETTKRGDRLCGMTLNPKTQVWNKPEKSTYSEVMVLVKNEIGYIRTYGWTTAYTTIEGLDKFLAFIGDYPLSDLQKEKIARGRTIYKIRDNITYEIKTRKFKNIITGEIVESVPIMEMKDYIEVEE